MSFLTSFAIFAFLISLVFPSLTQARKVRKVQEVNFSEMSIKGSVRNPDGAYLVQKRGLKFMPLHEVKKDMDARIRDSSFYVK